jgi:hypothetical protein
MLVFQVKGVAQKHAVERVKNRLPMVVDAAAHRVTHTKVRTVLFQHTPGRVEDATVIAVVTKRVHVPSGHASVQAERDRCETDRDALGRRDRPLPNRIVLVVISGAGRIDVSKYDTSLGVKYTAPPPEATKGAQKGFQMGCCFCAVVVVVP